MATINGAGGNQLHNMVSFGSTERVGTGSEETIAHGFGVTPSIVLLQPRDNSKSAVVSTQFDYVTVENAAIYDLLVLL